MGMKTVSLILYLMGNISYNRQCQSRHCQIRSKQYLIILKIVNKVLILNNSIKHRKMFNRKGVLNNENRGKTCSTLIFFMTTVNSIDKH